MPDKIDFFQCLESELEPVFDVKSYVQITPDLLKIIKANKLFKDAYLTEIQCDKCDNCPEGNALDIKHDKLIDKYYYTCPTGYLKNPVLLSSDGVKGWQFDVNRLAELICDKSKLTPGGATNGDLCKAEVKSIARDIINGKNIAVTYWRGLSRCDNITELIADTASMFRAKTLLVITPSLEAVTLDSFQLPNTSIIYLLHLKTVFEKDFDIRDTIIKKHGEKEAKGFIKPQFIIRLVTKGTKTKISAETDSNQFDVKQLAKDLSKSHKLLAIMVCSLIPPDKRFDSLLNIVNRFRQNIMKIKAIDKDLNNFLYKQIPALNEKFKKVFNIDLIIKTESDQYIWNPEANSYFKFNLEEKELAEELLVTALTEAKVISLGRPSIPDEEKAKDHSGKELPYNDDLYVDKPDE